MKQPPSPQINLAFFFRNAWVFFTGKEKKNKILI